MEKDENAKNLWLDLKKKFEEVNSKKLDND